MEEAADEMGINGIFTSDGELWKQQRKLITHAFQQENMKEFMPTMQLVTDRLINYFDECYAQRKKIDILEVINSYSVLHKIPAQNRFAASIPASKDRRRPRLYSFSRISPS